MIVTAGKTNVSATYYVVGDAGHATPGEPVTGLLFSDIETGGSASYVRQGAARADLTLITLASASATHADGGFILVDDTNMPGVYRCDYPDAAFATGVDEVSLAIVIASAKNAVAAPIKVQILDVDLRDAVRGGMTALPNAAADAAGGLPISDAGGLDIDTKLANTNEVTAARMGALTDWIDGGRLDLLLDAIPTTAMRGTDGANTTTPPTVAAIADQVWDELIAGHAVSGSTGESLSNASSAGDPWATLLPGAYGAGTAGKIVGDNINAPLDVIDTNVDTVLAAIGAAGAGLTDLGGMSTAMKAEVNAEADAAASDYGALKPTIAGRALDVSVGGEAGVDWANVGTPGATVSLADTTVAVVSVNADMRGTEGANTDTPLTAAEVNAEVDAALADINLDHLVGTATGIPAVPAGTFLDQFMDDGTATYDRTTDSLQAQRDNVDAGVAIGSAGIGSSSFAAGAIDAAAIAANAIGASELAADAVTEIWAKVVETNGSITAQQVMSLILAALAGVTNTAGATVLDPSGTSTRITATLNASNERTAMSLAPSA